MDSLVSTQWLADQLGAEDLVVLDASMHLPDSPRNAAADFATAHIPGACFLDLATFMDSASDVPKAVPTAAQFAGRLGQLGIVPESRVVLYDDSPIRSAARAWFIFRLYGFEQVAILDGGLDRWQAEGRPLAEGRSSCDESVFPEPSARAVVRTKAVMLANCGSHAEQVVDARDAARFAGVEGSGSAGHIPGAANVHFPRLFDAEGRYLPPAALAEIFTEEGLALDRPIVTSCNSGMTACVLAFALDRAGARDVAVYDGSWMEWGDDDATPKEQGAAR